MENLLYLFLLLALGNISRRFPAFPENTPNVLNQFVIYISFPATVLLKINGIDLQVDLMFLAFVPWVLVFLTIFSVRMISKFLQWDKKMTGAVMLSVALGNTAFFGYPAVSAFWGEDNLGYAIIYDQFGSFVALVTFGTIVVSIYGTSQKISLKSILLKIVSFPPFIALLAGLLLIKTSYPEMITNILEGLSATLVPLVIFSVGAQLKFRQPLSVFLKTAWQYKADCQAVTIIYSFSKSSFSAPQIGQHQSSGRSSKLVPGSMPLSGSPSAGSYT